MPRAGLQPPDLMLRNGGATVAGAGPLRLEDWRQASAAAVGRLYAAECERWQRELDWDFTPSCRVVEEARVAGRLPGFVVRDAGRVRGWTFFALHEQELQVGVLVASDDEALDLLVAGILSSPEAELGCRVSCFLYPDGVPLAAVLAGERFEVHNHPYLASALPLAGLPMAPREGAPPATTFRPLERTDVLDVVHVMARAYGDAPEARCFAPEGRKDQWARYVLQLLETPGCGRYLPCGSLVAESCGLVVGAVIATALSDSMAHIAQVVVDPAARGQGLGRQLVERACSAVSGRFAAVSLLVAESNVAAHSLYLSLGFERRANFVAGRLSRGDRRLRRSQAAGR